jgi:archaeoflavoprotein AfpA
MTLKIAWGISGSGDHLTESLEVMTALKKKYELEIDVALSRAGQIVVTWYKHLDALKLGFNNVLVERDSNTPFLVGPLQLGEYDLLLVCPATANTTAKIAHGIADSLLSNCVAQAVKAGVRVCVFPVDQKLGKKTTNLPDGKKLELSIRDVDVENSEKLRHMRGITMLSSPKEIESIIKKCM